MNRREFHHSLLGTIGAAVMPPVPRMLDTGPKQLLHESRGVNLRLSLQLKPGVEHSGKRGHDSRANRAKERVMEFAPVHRRASSEGTGVSR